MYFIQHYLSAAPPDSTVSEDAVIEPRTVATLALAVSRSNQLARSHPQLARSHPQLPRSHPTFDEKGLKLKKVKSIYLEE